MISRAVCCVLSINALIAVFCCPPGDVSLASSAIYSYAIQLPPEFQAYFYGRLVLDVLENEKENHSIGPELVYPCFPRSENLLIYSSRPELRFGIYLLAGKNLVRVSDGVFKANDMSGSTVNLTQAVVPHILSVYFEAGQDMIPGSGVDNILLFETYFVDEGGVKVLLYHNDREAYIAGKYRISYCLFHSNNHFARIVDSKNKLEYIFKLKVNTHFLNDGGILDSPVKAEVVSVSMEQYEAKEGKGSVR